jgi:tRNA(His) 5'-end guanylyltransferase
MGQNSSASKFIENILIILSNLPPGFRNGIIKKRLDEFNGFDQSEKKEIINNILKNYGKIEKTKVLDLFNSWLTSLTEMDNSSINSIFYSYLLELHLNPRELEAFDSRFVLSLVKVLNDMPKNKRDKLWYCFMEAVFNTPDPKKFIKLLPNYESNVK